MTKEKLANRGLAAVAHMLEASLSPHSTIAAET
jgi:hypothetical protein